MMCEKVTTPMRFAVAVCWQVRSENNITPRTFPSSRLNCASLIVRWRVLELLDEEEWHSAVKLDLSHRPLKDVLVGVDGCLAAKAQEIELGVRADHLELESGHDARVVPGIVVPPVRGASEKLRGVAGKASCRAPTVAAHVGGDARLGVRGW